MDNFVQNNYTLNNWMTATPAIDTLSLCELTLPGTHNAGCDWKASWPLIPGAHWLACQHESFYAQLSHGSRALDIRLMYDAGAQGLGKFCIHHNGYRNGRTLGNLVTDVEKFLRENPNEFIILDFHELKGDQFDFAYFNSMMMHVSRRSHNPHQKPVSESSSTQTNQLCTKNFGRGPMAQGT